MRRDITRRYITRHTNPREKHYHAPDKDGREQFTIHWWGYNPSLGIDSWRAQVFYAVLANHVKETDVIETDGH